MVVSIDGLALRLTMVVSHGKYL